ncbi:MULTISPECIES: EamA family transporter [unclassified Haladaptatus]|uniref:EamA family transporter n=1 Tax=unclassified Haladaptatus TaxID=2622732 RepID=UPI0023E8905F|nr:MULTISPECIES: EamA family transporter [unclassified Haladaptatus]
MSNNLAVVFALVAMVSWGVWAVFADMATRSLEPEVAMIISYIVGIVIALGYVLALGKDLSVGGPGLTFAIAAGVFSGIAAVAFYAGLSAGRTGIVTTVSALYFVVAAIIAVLVLGDSMDLSDIVGVGFAILAVVMLAR